MKREFLKELGIADEAIDKIMAENGKDITTEQTKTTTAETKLAAAEKTAKDLQEAVKKFDGVDVEKLKKDASDWETKYNADISKIKLENALDMALITGKAKNVKAVKALLDIDEIKIDGGKLLGLDTQLEKLKAENAFLFYNDQTSDDDKGNGSGADQNSSSFRANSGGTHKQTNATDFDKMSDEEYYKTTMTKNKE